MEKSIRDKFKIDSPFFQWVVNNAPIVLFAVDRKGVFTLSEGQALKSLGLKPGQVVGTSVFDLYADFPKITDSIRLSLAGETTSYEVSLGDRVFETTCSPLENEVGKIIGVVGVASDQTDRKQSEKELRHSEEKFRRIFEDSSVGMAITELDGRFNHVNDALINMLGYSTEELLKMSVSDITHPDDIEKTLEDYERIFTDKTKQGSIEKRCLHRDGSVVWGFITRSIIRDNNGNPQYTVSQVKDITQRKRAEIELSDSEERYRRFAADVAHELRTPLSTMHLHLNDLGDSKSAKAIKQDVESMSRLVEQLLSLAQLDAMYIESNDKADLRDVCTKVLIHLGPIAIKEGRSLEFVGPGDPVKVHGNSYALELAVRNLVENAIKYSNRDSEITTEVYENGTIKVIDRGRGIPKEKHNKIFERFERSDLRGGGAGLGLSIVKHTVESHGGTIKVSETPGGGATFTISFTSVV